jgi:hypothetical protein
MAEDSILIIGAANIAKALGLSLDFVRSCLLGNPDFPAKKEARRWITTRRLLADWADGLVRPTSK